jgi:hypothetical protein
MSGPLNPDLRLSALAATVRDLRNKGYEVIDAQQVMTEHNEKGGYAVTEKDVIRRVCSIMKELHKVYPDQCIHLVSEYYVIEMPSFKKVAGYRLPPKTQWELDALVEAVKCLAIFQKGVGLRFPKEGKLDWLFRVNEAWHILATIPKLVSRIHKISVGASKKLIPERESMNHIVGAVLSIPKAIDNPEMLPKELRQAKLSVEDSIRASWEKNFNKDQQGKWRL